MARPTGRPVRDEVLVAARGLIQNVGVGAFSYSDLSAAIGIKAPSIHHHFRHKEDLVAEVAEQYRAEFAAEVDAIAGATVSQRLRAFAELFVDTAAKNMMCLCGAVAAEWSTVGEAPRKQVEGFVEDQVAWLAAQVEEGASSGELRADIDPRVTARAILAMLEGAILMGRVDASSNAVSPVSEWLVSLLASDST